MTTSADPTRSPRKDTVRNRAALVEAARAAFTAQGLDAPLERIAAAAGLGNATLYRHFPTRANLWEAVLLEPLREVRDLVEDCLRRAETDPWDGFSSFARGTARIEARRAGYSELMTTRYDGAPELLRVRAEIQRGVESLFRQASEAGAIRSDAVLEDFALVQISTAAVIRTFGDVAPAVHQRWVDLILDGFRAPEAARDELGAPALRPNQIWRAVMRRHQR